MVDIKRPMSPEAQILLDEITQHVKKAISKSIWECNVPNVKDTNINGWALKYEFNEDPELIKNNIIDCTIIAIPPLNKITLNFIIDKNGVIKHENNEQPTK